MLFQINLVKDRVVPRNLQLKRVIIAGSEIGVVVLVALVIMFMGLRLQPQINEQKKTLQEIKTLLANLEASYQDSENKEKDRIKAQTEKAKLFRLWNTPVNFNVAMELMYDCVYAADGYSKDDVRVRKVVFGEPLQDPNSVNYRPPSQDKFKLRMIVLLRKHEDFAPFMKNIEKLVGKENEVVSDYSKRGGFKGPKGSKWTKEFSETDEKSGKPEQFSPPQPNGGIAELTFLPANENFYKDPGVPLPK